MESVIQKEDVSDMMVPQPQVPKEGCDPAQEQEQSPSEHPLPHQGPGRNGRVRHRPHPHHGQGQGQSGEGTGHHPRDLNPMPVSEFQDQQTVVCPRPPHPTPMGRLRPMKKPKAEGQQEPTGPPSNRHFLDCAQGSLEHVRKVGQPHPQPTPRTLTGGHSPSGSSRSWPFQDNTSPSVLQGPAPSRESDRACRAMYSQSGAPRAGVGSGWRAEITHRPAETVWAWRRPVGRFCARRVPATRGARNRQWMCMPPTSYLYNCGILRPQRVWGR